MRKLLLVTTALVGFTGAAHAATSPLAVSVGGSVDFRAAMFHESDKSTTGESRASSDFENKIKLKIEAAGKANNGVEYGAVVGLEQQSATNSVNIQEDYGYLWMSGNFGKVVMGDTLAADVDMFVTAPTVGIGQTAGDFDHFVDTFNNVDATYFSNTDYTTRIAFYSPKVGNENHKVQLGMSFAPNSNDQGLEVNLRDDSSLYRNVMGFAAQYTGAVDAVALKASAVLTSAEAADVDYRDYTSYGLGAQATYAGVTVGGSYVDAGHAYTTKGDTEEQNVWTIGAKYGFDKVEVAANYKEGQGYLTTGGHDYINFGSAIGVGAVYTWFPGMTTAADAVFFQQGAVETTTTDRDPGHVFMISQKLAF